LWDASSDIGENEWLNGDEGDVPGPVPVAVAVTKKTVVVPDKVSDEARLVVIGDSTFASNRFKRTGGNADLFAHALSWLSGEEGKIAIRPRRRGANHLPLNEAQQYGIVFFSVNLLPLLIVSVGFSVWALRRRK